MTLLLYVTLQVYSCYENERKNYKRRQDSFILDTASSKDIDFSESNKKSEIV